MADFYYVTKKEAREAKRDVIDIIREVQEIVRDEFTFQYTFIGSCARNMITYDRDSNVGYDFDVNLEVNDPNQDYDPEEIRSIIFDAIQQVAPRYSYEKVENSTRVITIKIVDRENSCILHSCDFAIVNNLSNGQQRYIRLNKNSYTFTWEFQGKGYVYLPDKIEWLKENGLWADVRAHYLFKKDNNHNHNKHSRTIFAETINEMCQKNGYYN